MDSEIVGEDFLDFKCPYCGSLNSFPTRAAKLVRECFNCIEVFLVPAKDGDPAQKLPLPIEVSKVRLRTFVATDWKDLLEFQFADEDEATGWIHTLTTGRLINPQRTFYLAVETRETPKVISTLSLRFTDAEFNQMELSLSSNANAATQELELETFEAALDFCFQELHLHRVTTDCGSSDAERRQLFRELGMRQEAELLKHYRMGDEWQSTVCFAMLEEEYFTDAPSGQTS